MKKLILLPLLCLAVLTAWADEQKKVTLSNDNPKEVINLSYANIFVSLLNGDDDQGQVLIEIENLDETKILALFHKPYTEKQVKKLSHKFRYDKLFGGTKGKRIIDPYNLETGKDVYIEPSMKYNVAAFNVTPDKNLMVHLPIYIAKPKKGIIEKLLGGEKLMLMRKQLIEIDVEVSLRPSAEYTGLQGEVEALKREVKNTVFCTSNKHKQSVEQQQQPYVQRISALKKKIDNAISAHGWQPGDSGYTRYNALKTELDGIDLNKHLGTCSQHRVPIHDDSHSCNYCNLTLQQIYHRLDDLYKKIYTSSDRAATKASVIGQVNALYTCCTATNCAKHKAAWARGGNGYKSKITERYNRIQGL
jgi:hypothetical protein